MFEENKIFTINDNVLINSIELDKLVIGCIEEINENQGFFFYSLYYNVQDLGINKREFHGKNELFKTDDRHKESINQIMEKVEILKLKDYIQRIKTVQDNDTKQFYVKRQFFDVNSCSFTPEDLKTCFCKKVINTDDDDIIICPQCESVFYHFKCIKENTLCLECNSLLDQEKFIGQIGLKRQRSQDQSNSLQQDEMVVMKKTKTNINKDRIKELWNKMNKQPQPEEQFEPERQLQVDQKLSSSSQKNKPFPNIGEDQVEKINQLLEKYKYNSLTSKLTGIEKKRQEIKERFFQSLVYGVEELRLLKGSSLSEKEKEIAMNEAGTYDLCKRLAIEIETTLFNICNHLDRSQLNGPYKERFKIIQINLRDDKNFELRRKVLTNVFTPHHLVVRNEIELYNNEKKQEILRQEKRNFEQDKIEDYNKIIIKTSKGVEIIEKDSEEQKEELEKNVKDLENKKQQESKKDNFSQSTLENNNLIKDISNNVDYSKNYKLYRIMHSKSKDIDQDFVNSMIDLISEKSYQKMEQRLKSDLPEIEGSILNEKLKSMFY